MNTGGYGQLDVERRALDTMTPEEQAALIRGEYLPERLAELRSSSADEQQRLKGQLDSVHQMMGQPIPVRGNSVGLAMGGLLANALRDFGGMYIAGQKEKQMTQAQADADAKFQNLIKTYGEDATGAGLSTKRRGLGLSDAVRGYGTGGGYSL